MKRQRRKHHHKITNQAKIKGNNILTKFTSKDEESQDYRGGKMNEYTHIATLNTRNIQTQKNAEK